MPAITCSAPGKIILCGEHAAVYGSPAIAIPVFDVKTKCTIIARPTACTDDPLIVAPDIALRCHLTCLVENHPIRMVVKLVLDRFKLDHLPVCEIQIHSTLPTAAGMGSSASTAVALIRALSTFLGHPFENEVVNELAFEIEKIHHGSPSGIDNSVITYQKCLYFIKGQPFQLLEPKATFTLVIADSGIKSTTARVVEQVRLSYQDNKPAFEQYFSEIGNVSDQIRKDLILGNISDIGTLMTKNHKLLQTIGVSCEKLDTLVACALDAGSLGAKLSGGGKGGNMIALVNDETADTIADKLRSCGAVNTIIIRVPTGG